MTSPDPTFCPAPGCKRGPRRGLLCGQHADRLGQTLADLTVDLAGGSHEPSLIGWRTGSTSGGTLASERDPINLRILDAQAQAPPVLAAWAIWLCGERPNLTRLGGASGDRELLARHLDWIMRHPEVDHFWCQIRALWASLRGHLPVRRCTCGGPVWSELGGGWCSWCASPWTGADLLRLPANADVA